MSILDHLSFAEIEAERATLFAKLKTGQAAAKGSRFVQLPVTPETKGDGTARQTFDTSRKAAGETKDWSDLGVSLEVAAGTLASYEAHQYVGPSGAGYVLHCWVKHEGKTYLYRDEVGAEDRGAGHDVWIEMDPALP